MQHAYNFFDCLQIWDLLFPWASQQGQRTCEKPEAYSYWNAVKGWKKNANTFLEANQFSIRLKKLAHVIKVNRFRRGRGVGRRARGHQLETQFVRKNTRFMQGDPYLPQDEQNIMVVHPLCFIWKSLSFIYQSLSFIYKAWGPGELLRWPRFTTVLANIIEVRPLCFIRKSLFFIYQ